MEVTSIDLGHASDEQVAALRDLASNHCVVLIRGQQAGAAELAAFGHRVAPVAIFEENQTVPGFSEVVQIGAVVNTTEIWHSDGTFRDLPPSYSILSGQVLPSAGGDTIFANQYAAYEALSPALQEALSRLKAVHEARYSYTRDRDGLHNVHPVVRLHPDTERPALFVNPLFVHRFDGMMEEESQGLLQYLFRRQVAPEFVYRHRWSHGDVLMWDNRCTLHYAVGDYAGEPRLMYRVQTKDGMPPVGSAL
jgi:taurine dioxygenase